MSIHTQKNTAGKPVSIVWLRRDLRLYEHAPLLAALKTGLPVQMLFVFDTEILERFANRDDRRLTFIAAALCDMHNELRKRGGGLLMLHGKATQVIPALCDALHCSHVFAGEDYEPQTRARDAKVKETLAGKTDFTLLNNHLLLTPQQVLKEDGTPFRVFTPYSKAWRRVVVEENGFEIQKADSKGTCADYEQMVQAAKAAGVRVLDPAYGPKGMLAAIDYREQDMTLWPVDEARGRLYDFIDHRVKQYDRSRDFPAKPGTSRLSPYLRFGLLSVRECARLALEHEQHGASGAATWVNELIWRDFYAMILYHYPHTVNEEMQAQYRSIKWSYNQEHFKHFAEGMTGYPIIDAAMRELLTTGYMHNRARMIVASFMTKDLLLDWRMGEEHFAQHLMDYELASNVGGWQWAASTGTDAQPYFRVFNPVLQSKKFDPNGDYIRAYVPELADLAANAIHEPWITAKPAGYPAPIVQHDEARVRAIAAFKQASGG